MKRKNYDAVQERSRAFNLYEQGKQYNNRLTPSYYTLVDRNSEFFAGNQWVHLAQTKEMARLPKPVFNVIKRVSTVLISQIASGGVAVNLEPLSYYDGGEGDLSGQSATEFAQSELENILEKVKIEYRLRDALFDGAKTGDYCAHFYWDADALPYGGASGSYRGEIQMELVDGVNVMFGNPNDSDAQKQPYILLIGRDTVKNLRDEYLENHHGDEMGASLITPDAEYTEQVASGGKVELHGEDNAKALYILMYEKVVTEEDMFDIDGNPVMETCTDSDGEPVYETNDNDELILDFKGMPIPKQKQVRKKVTSVHVSKYTERQSIFENIDTGLQRYPIAWGNWEKQKNCYHGRALVTGIIPNQIFINMMYSMVMHHLQLESFPKTVYNADLIGTFSNEIGQAVAVHGLQPGQAINQVATNLAPADMSNQILSVINAVVALTKECMGISDIQLGNVKNENTSAIMIMESNAETPLENIRANLYEWCEDIASILLDMMGTYYGKRPISRSRTFEEPVMDASSGQPVMDQYTGVMKTVTSQRKVMEDYDFDRLKNMWLNVRVDVGRASTYSEIAMTQTLDNLREAQMIDIIDYLERIPDKLIPRKRDLIDKLKDAQIRQDGVPAGSAIPDSQVDAETQPLMMQMNPGGGSTSNRGKKGGDNIFGGALDQEKAISMLPDNLQAQMKNMTGKSKSAVAKMMAMKSDKGG